MNNNLNNNNINTSVSNQNNNYYNNMNTGVSSQNNNYYNNMNTGVSGQNTNGNNYNKLSFDEIENLRITAKNNFFKLCTIFSLLSIILFVLFRINFGSKYVTLVYFLFFSLLLSYLFNFLNVKNFKDAYKKYFAIAVFEKKCDNVYFDLNRGMDEDIIRNTGMMIMGDRFSSNDYISGKYKSVNFEFSDVHIEDEYTDSEGHTHYTTLFRGQWFIFDFHKNFKSNLQICEKAFRNAKRNTLFGSEKYSKVALEDIEFNKTFKVFAQNDLEAFYILTPHTVENIKTLNNKLSGALLFCFVDNKLHVGLHSNKDSFEASIFKRIDESAAAAKVNLEIDDILNFVDILNLDNTLFKQ